jgi:hypothetical protein
MTTPEPDTNLVIQAWRTAGDRLGVVVEAPYDFSWAGRSHSCLAFLPHFGTRRGILVLGTHPPDFDTDPYVAADAASADMGCSFINVERYRTYDEEQFQSTLSEWGYFGPGHERPLWLR